MLEQALQGARLLFAYTLIVQAPVEEVFKYTAEPEYWTRDFDGESLPNLTLLWEGKECKAGSIMVLSSLRKDGTPTPVGSVRMELLHYARDQELSFRFLNGTHLIYRFVYEQAAPNHTEFTVNVLLDAESPYINTIRQRLYANRRRKESIKNHLRAKSNIEARFRPRRSA